MNIKLHEITWTEAKKYFATNDLVILPVGSNEQHGHHNPLGTDHLIARELAEKAAKQTRTLCLQVIPFGVSGIHRHFWGTINISPRVFKAYVRDVCLALKYYDVKKIVVVNGHGGNRSVLIELARELREDGVFLSIFQWWEVAQEILPDIFTLEERGHAGAEETSLNLALHWHLVKMSEIVDEEPRKSSLDGKGISLPLNTVDLTVSGVYGKSSTASSEKGEQLLKAVVDKLAEHIQLLKASQANELFQDRRI